MRKGGEFRGRIVVIAGKLERFLWIWRDFEEFGADDGMDWKICVGDVVICFVRSSVLRARTEWLFLSLVLDVISVQAFVNS